MFYVKKFKRASGLELNMDKTYGKFYNKQNFHQIRHLPSMKWEDKISVVKVHHSPRSLVMSQWNDVLHMFKGEVKYFKSLATTLNQKLLLVNLNCCQS